MAADNLQSARIGALVTPLGPDAMVLIRLDANEAVSGLFEFRIEALADDPAVDFNAMIGRHVTVEINTITHGIRHFDGLLTEARALGLGEGGYTYQMVLRPWLWLLSKRVTSKIFHEKTVIEIITEVFGDHAFADFTDSTQGSFPVLEYTAQFCESDFNFISRLLETHGIAYYFTFADGAHTMVLTDGPEGYTETPGGARPFIGVAGQNRADREHFTHWQAERRYTTGRVALDDYDFKRPSMALGVEMDIGAAYEHAGLESFAYPSRYVEEADGAALAQARLDMLASGDGRQSASGDCMSLAAGQMMTLTDHPDAALNTGYLVLRCTHSFFAESYRSTGERGQESYMGHYEFLPATQRFVPPATAQVPTVQGPQTATVVGDGDIDCDEHGRILVHFHWDRARAHSMRCRVAQIWAGKGWGGITIPRVGMEVIVEFLEGNPDRPIVIGCVYNGENTPPFELPGSENISGIMSNTIGGGGYNEMVMDDTPGAELFRQHAQFDMEEKVLNDLRREVLNDETVEIANNLTTTIGNDEARNVGANQSLEVGADQSETIGSNQTITVGNSLTIDAGSDITLTVGGSSIRIDGTSIAISSMDISIDGMSLSTTGSMTADHSAGAMMTIKGALVKIN